LLRSLLIGQLPRVTGHSRNTVARWLERASRAATRFNDLMLHDFDFIELQADEFCTFVGNKNTTVWLFATIEVSSRVWASSVLGRRSDRNARAVIEDLICRGRLVGCCQLDDASPVLSSSPRTRARLTGARHPIPFGERARAEQTMVGGPEQMAAAPEEVLHDAVDRRSAGAVPRI
jgi:hypothetical protein